MLTPQHVVRGVGWRVAVIVLVLGVLGGLGYGMHALYEKRVQSTRHQVERELLAIATLQADSVADWRDKRMSDALALTDEAWLSRAVGQWLVQSTPALTVEINERLRILVERSRYTAAFLVDTQGQLRLSSQGPVSGPLPAAEREALASALDQAVATTVDPRSDAFFAFPFFSQIAPLFEGIRPVGAIWLVSDVRASLYPLVQTWPTPSASAEAVIVSHQAHMPRLLSPLRGELPSPDATSGVAHWPTTHPLVQAVSGVRGIFGAEDGLGHPVIAMAAAVPESDWLLVAKVDEAEVLDDSRWRELLILGLPVAACLFLIGGGVAVWLHQAWQRERSLKAQLERNMRWLEGAQKAASAGYFAHDQGTGDMSLSRMACRILGLPEQAVFSHEQWLARLSPTDREEWLVHYRQAAANRSVVHTQCHIRRACDDTLRWVDVWGEFEDEGPPGQMPRLLGTLQDITERKRTEDELQTYRALLEDKVRRDPLTGIANRRALDECVHAEWFRALRSRWPLAVVMIDVDHFKAYNDHYGHVAGDHCLQQIAQAMAAAVTRAGELVARYGGEEFAIVLPNTRVPQAVAVAERVVAAVRALALPHAHSGVAPHVTVSAGVACFDPPPWEPGQVERAPAGETDPSLWGDTEALFQRADAALYEAKQQGRDRVVVIAAT